MKLEKKAIKQFAVGGLLGLPILCAALAFAIPKAIDIFHYGEVYRNLLIKYGDTNKDKKVDEKEKEAFQGRIVSNSKDRKIEFVQIIDIPHTEYPRDMKNRQLIPPEEFVRMAEKDYSQN
jgi:hypothetical protein